MKTPLRVYAASLSPPMCPHALHHSVSRGVIEGTCLQSSPPLEAMIVTRSPVVSSIQTVTAIGSARRESTRWMQQYWSNQKKLLNRLFAPWCDIWWRTLRPIIKSTADFYCWRTCPRVTTFYAFFLNRKDTCGYTITHGFYAHTNWIKQYMGMRREDCMQSSSLYCWRLHSHVSSWLYRSRVRSVISLSPSAAFTLLPVRPYTSTDLWCSVISVGAA